MILSYATLSFFFPLTVVSESTPQVGLTNNIDSVKQAYRKVILIHELIFLNSITSLSLSFQYPTVLIDVISNQINSFWTSLQLLELKEMYLPDVIKSIKDAEAAKNRVWAACIPLLHIAALLLVIYIGSQLTFFSSKCVITRIFHSGNQCWGNEKMSTV